MGQREVLLEDRMNHRGVHSMDSLRFHHFWYRYQKFHNGIVAQRESVGFASQKLRVAD